MQSIELEGPLSYRHSPSSRVYGVLADPDVLSGLAPLLDGTVSVLARMRGVEGTSIAVGLQRSERAVVPFMLHTAMNDSTEEIPVLKEGIARKLVPGFSARVRFNGVAALTFTTETNRAAELVQSEGPGMIELAQQAVQQYAEVVPINFESLRSQN